MCVYVRMYMYIHVCIYVTAIHRRVIARARTRKKPSRYKGTSKKSENDTSYGGDKNRARVHRIYVLIPPFLLDPRPVVFVRTTKGNRTNDHLDVAPAQFFFVSMSLEVRDACPVCMNYLVVNVPEDKVFPMKQTRERVHIALRNFSHFSFLCTSRDISIRRYTKSRVTYCH